MADRHSPAPPPPPPPQPPQRPPLPPPRHPHPAVVAARGAGGPWNTFQPTAQPCNDFTSMPASSVAHLAPRPFAPFVRPASPFISNPGTPLFPPGLATPLSLTQQQPSPPPSGNTTLRDTNPSRSVSPHLAILLGCSASPFTSNSGTPLMTTPLSTSHQQLPPPPPPPPSLSSATPRSGKPRGTTGSRSSSPHMMRPALISLGECVVCPNALPAAKVPKLPKAARASLPEDLPDLFVCSPACAYYLQGTQLTASPSGRQAMGNLQRWATHMCGTSVRVGDSVQVFDKTLKGFNVAASDFPNGGRVTRIRFTGKPIPLQCEIWVRPPIGGASVKVLPTGVKIMYVK